MNPSNDRAQTLDSNELNHALWGGQAGVSTAAGLEVTSNRPAADDFPAENWRKQFLAIVLHELKNPLGAILTSDECGDALTVRTALSIDGDALPGFRKQPSMRRAVQWKCLKGQ